MVTRVGFGGIPIQRLEEDDAVEVVRHTLDRGVNFIDSSRAYSNSEGRIGQAIAGRRDGLILATKSPARTGEGLRADLAESLKLLGADYIDLYQLHNVSDRETLDAVLAPGGPLDAAKEAQRAGIVGHIGVTSHSLDIVIEALNTGEFATVMAAFNFVNDRAMEKLLPLARELDVGFIAMKPLAGGRLDTVNTAFKYLWQYPEVLSLVGIDQPWQIDQIVDLLETSRDITAADREEMARLKAEIGQRFCRTCDYCQPCTQQIRISSVLAMRSTVLRFPKARVFGDSIAAIMATANDCSDCGDCEARCPYKLPIREMLTEEYDWYRRERESYFESCREKDN
jgi:predicted aldo/keto reductase-like oxidoreductase